MIKYFTLLTLFIQVAWAAPDCGLNLTLTNATVQAMSTQQVIQQNFTVSRFHPNNNRCSNYILYFGKGLANNYQRMAYNTSNQTYNYNLHSNINMNGILKDKNDAQAMNEVIIGGTPNDNTTYSGSFFVSIPATGTNPVGGTFTDNVQVQVYRASNVNDQNLEEVETFTISIIIPTLLSISLVDEGGSFNASSTSKVMDFGIISQNAELRADLMVMSNTPYQIKFSSANNGVLKNGSNTYAYELKVSSNVVGLGSSAGTPVTVATSTNASSTSGDRYNVRVKMTESPTNKPAGLYQDTITITAIAN